MALHISRVAPRQKVTRKEEEEEKKKRRRRRIENFFVETQFVFLLLLLLFHLRVLCDSLPLFFFTTGPPFYGRLPSSLSSKKTRPEFLSSKGFFRSL